MSAAGDTPRKRGSQRQRAVGQRAITVDVGEGWTPSVSLTWAASEADACTNLALDDWTRHSEWPTTPSYASAMRRRHWLAGRFALKSGLVAGGLLPDPHDPTVVVGITSEGSRQLVTVGGVPLEPPVQASLSHSGLHAACALQAHREPGLGLDVEEDWNGAQRNLRRFATEEELKSLRQACGAATPAHLWCVKEAIAKATGWGFTIAPKRYQICSPPLGRDTLEVRVSRLPDSVGRLVSRVVLGTRRTPSPAAWALVRVSSGDQVRVKAPSSRRTDTSTSRHAHTSVGSPYPV
jgi:phosphopantetheinyl transferase